MTGMLGDPVGRSVTVPRPDGTRLHALDAGTGPPVVLAHGYGASVQGWSLVQPALLDRGLRVIAYDHRAHGASTLGGDGIASAALFADLAAVVEHFELRDVTLAGHSMGTFAVMGGLAHPGLRARTHAAVLVSPETGTLLKGAAPSLRLLAPLAQAGLLARLCRQPAIGRLAAAQVCGPGASAEVLEATRRMLASPSRVVSRFMKVMNEESVAAALPAIDVPVTVLWGTADGTTPRWHADLIVQRAADARLELLDGVGHMPPWEAPERVVDAIAASALAPQAQPAP